MANRVLKFLIIGLLTSAFLQAQEAPKPLPRHPGDVIKYEIEFGGPNADKIKTVSARMNTDRVPKDQSGFTTQINTSGEFKESSPKTFVIEMKIPDNAATGDYRLFVNANATEGGASYADGQEFNIPAIRVENPRTFAPPAITVKPLP